jgi:hypothetical protein
MEKDLGLCNKYPFNLHATLMTATTSELEELLKVVGDEVIRAYRDKVCSFCIS